MQKVIYLILSILAYSCNNNVVNEQKVCNRIEFVFNLKQTINDKVWKTFTDKQFDVPLIYFTDSASFVANPTEKFLSTFKSNLVFENEQIKIYKTAQRIDHTQFHMETGLTLGTPTNEYTYHSPFMKCSSYEDVFKQIPDVSSTEEWVTMIMHEYFHCFQYKHNAYIDYYEKNIVQIQPDSLTAIYKNNAWFKKSIDHENELLLNAINETDNLKTEQLIDSFIEMRKQRRIETKQLSQLDITNFEKYYETMEGTARYVEYSLYHLFSTSQLDCTLLESDTSFKSFRKFKNYNMEHDKWLYLTERTTYFYAIGFNMARLLDKLKIEYKTKLFNQGGLSLEDILMNRKKRQLISSTHKANDINSRSLWFNTLNKNKYL